MPNPIKETKTAMSVEKPPTKKKKKTILTGNKRKNTRLIVPKSRIASHAIHVELPARGDQKPHEGQHSPNAERNQHAQWSVMVISGQLRPFRPPTETAVDILLDMTIAVGSITYPFPLKKYDGTSCANSRHISNRHSHEYSAELCATKSISMAGSSAHVAPTTAAWSKTRPGRPRKWWPARPGQKVFASDADPPKRT